MNDVRQFGARGDGVTKDTRAIQSAIDAGGVAWFPPGIYLSGTLYLKSGGGLHLEAGAVLLASPDRADYNADDFCPQNRVFAQENVSGAHFIVAVEQENVSVTGTGRIDGNRQAFYPAYRDGSETWTTPIAWRPGQMLYFCECENVTLDGVQLYDAPYWTCFLHGCENVTVRGLNIRNWKHTRNGDGIDLDCCRMVTVSDCIIDAGDDAITLRGYDEPLKKKRACEFITISNCILKSTCNALRIGVGGGVVRRATIADVIIHDTRAAVTLCSKYAPDRGVLIEDIVFHHIQLEAVVPLRILINTGRGTGPAIQPIRRISFQHWRGRSQFGVAVAGEAAGDISDLTFDDIELECAEIAAERPPRITEANGVPAAFWFENTDRVFCNRVRVRNASSDRCGLHQAHCRDFQLRDCDFGKITDDRNR